jgi:protein O-GlcNAc transferase
MKHWRIALALAAGLSAGCGGNKDVDNKGVPRHTQQLVKPEDRQFEQAKDPPLTANTHFAAGQLAETQGNLTVALEQYARALKIEPKHEASVFRTAIVYSRMGQHPQAIATWKRYIELMKTSAAGYSNLGLAYELAGERDHAEVAYRRGIDLDPKNQPCRVNYGLMLARAGRTEDAVEQLGAVLTPAQVHYNLGSVYESMGAREKAKLEYRKSLELDPGLKAAQMRLAGVE